MTLEIQNLVGLDFVWRSVLYGNITGNIIRGLKNGRSGKVDQIVTVLAQRWRVAISQILLHYKKWADVHIIGRYQRMSPSFHGGKLRDESTRSPDTFWYFLHVLDSRLSNYFCHYANLASFWPKTIQIPYYTSHITVSTGIYISKEVKYEKLN